MDIEGRIGNLFPREEDIPFEYRVSEPVDQTEYLINGELHHWEGPREKVLSPVCVRNGGEEQPKYLGSYPLLTGEESTKALIAAVKAYDSGQGTWPTMCVEERIACVEDFTYRMGEKREEVIRLLMWEIGKNAKDSAKEFDRTITYIKDTVDVLKDLDRASSRFVIESGIIAQIRRAPLGVVLCMGPYNYPLNETFTVLVPALIMGNTVVFKPPKMGVLLHRPLLEALRDAFPEGVVNTVYGDGAEVIGPIISSGKVDCLAFIGSTKVADLLKSQHPQPHRLRSVLGLGAKNPAIILPDADLDVCAQECVLGALSYNGQRCTALKLLFVHQSIADSFAEKVAELVGNLNIGMPWEEGVNITPLPEPSKPEYLSGLVEDAKVHGARVLNPSGGSLNKTFFYPAVLYPVSSDMRVYHEEQFGPVVPIVPFNTIEEPVEYIIKSHYGQQASIFGNDSDQIARLIDPIVNQVCRVNLNSQCQRGPDTFPFTGRKSSAEGTLSVSDALKVFSIRTLVAAKGSERNKAIINDIVRQRRSKFLSDDFIL